MAKMTKNEEWVVSIGENDTPEDIIAALLSLPSDTEVFVEMGTYSKHVFLTFYKKKPNESD
jgi:hypothetical protein